MSLSSALRPLRLLAVAVVALASFLALGSVASAQTECPEPPPYGGPVTSVPEPGGPDGPNGPGGTTTPTVCSETVTSLPPPVTEPEPPLNIDNPDPTVLPSVSTRGLALTGGDVIGLVAIGGGALAVGAALVLATRRRRALEIA